MPELYDPAAQSGRRIVINARISFPTMSGSRELDGGETEVKRWRDTLHSRMAHPCAAMRITFLQYLVACTTIELVLMKYEQPSRQQIVARIVADGRACSLRTVERAHIRLAQFGFLRWFAEYEIGSPRRDGAGCGAQARRVENRYVFMQPPAGPPMPISIVRMIPRLHSCDRPSRLPPYDRQSGGVNINRYILSNSKIGTASTLITDPVEQAAAKSARIRAYMKDSRMQNFRPPS